VQEFLEEELHVAAVDELHIVVVDELHAGVAVSRNSMRASQLSTNSMWASWLSRLSRNSMWASRLSRLSMNSMSRLSTNSMECCVYHDC
jgi:hypothetical protein